MARKFAEITFTASVKAAQERYGSRQSNQGFEIMETGPDLISSVEAEFIHARDGFYQATANAEGWPYVQFRGGPKGFLRVIDKQTLGYADFRGNVQYLSVGNMGENDRVALILMDYANRRRLKIWARASIVEYDDNPELISKLEIPTYRARVERGIILKVEAFDWNCPQHITPRFTEDEINQLVAPMQQRIEELEKNTKTNSQSKSLGWGELKIEVTGIRQLTPDVRAYEFRRPDRSELPKVSAGSHLTIPVEMSDGQIVDRTYSVASNPNRRDIYEIAVLKEKDGRGGSKAVHDTLQLGSILNIDLPKNAFPLHQEKKTTILIAGGIGITPIKSMAQELRRRRHRFELHYAARSRQHMAYRSKLELELGSDLHLYPLDEGKMLDIQSLLRDAQSETVFYICGPQGLITAFVDMANTIGFPKEQIHYELFKNSADTTHDTAFDIYLEKSDKHLHVAQDQSILDAMLDAGLQPQFGCTTGGCGQCAVKISEGEIDHRDLALSDQQREKENLMCICVSRAKSKQLVLDA
ncbi:2Fe-2S iron-sulfur cluster-binding protein [Curvivirga sp.]|uniref:2Fe-2S iron-sulfur cluster-binding protein n=1 Tax=Curvivirga sp. TaxID=2856848 RepID=UPI003B5920D7